MLGQHSDILSPVPGFCGVLFFFGEGVPPL